MIDLLVIGNPTIDYIEGEFFGPGGPVTYISNSLSQLGQNKIDIVTSFGKDFSEENFPDCKNLLNIKSDHTNIFDFFFTSKLRRMNVIHGGKKIKLSDIKIKKEPDLIFISPVLNEFSIDKTKQLMEKFKSSFFIGIPQGWIRKVIGEEVKFDFSGFEKFPRFDILFFSDEELSNSRNSLEKLRKLSNILVITRGSRGVSVYEKDEILNFPSVKVDSVNSIGAGDIFATVFSIKYYQLKNKSLAAKFANQIAAHSTRYEGLKSINPESFYKSMKK